MRRLYRWQCDEGSDRVVRREIRMPAWLADELQRIAKDQRVSVNELHLAILDMFVELAQADELQLNVRATRVELRKKSDKVPGDRPFDSRKSLDSKKLDRPAQSDNIRYKPIDSRDLTE